jgi:hypothetical protein
MYKDQLETHFGRTQRTHSSHLTPTTYSPTLTKAPPTLKMQFTLAVLSGLALVTSAVAQAKEARALDFTTWPCNECARNVPPGCGSQQINHHDRFSDTCYPLKAGQQSIIVDHVTDANPSCTRNFPYLSYTSCHFPILSPKTTFEDRSLIFILPCVELTAKTVQLYGSANCTGSGPTFDYEPARNCKPIPVNERTSYKIIC